VYEQQKYEVKVPITKYLDEVVGRGLVESGIASGGS